MTQTLNSNFVLVPVVIPTDADGLTDAGIDMRGMVLVGIMMPAAWTAASITFQGSMDNSTFYDIYDEDGNEITWTGAAASRFLLQVGTQPMIGGINYLKVRSGVTGTAVQQGAARTLQLVFAVPSP